MMSLSFEGEFHQKNEALSNKTKGHLGSRYT